MERKEFHYVQVNVKLSEWVDDRKKKSAEEIVNHLRMMLGKIPSLISSGTEDLQLQYDRTDEENVVAVVSEFREEYASLEKEHDHAEV